MKMSLFSITHGFDLFRDSGSKELANFRQRVWDSTKEKFSGEFGVKLFEGKVKTFF